MARRMRQQQPSNENSRPREQLNGQDLNELFDLGQQRKPRPWNSAMGIPNMSKLRP